MAKPRVERAPSFNISDVDYAAISPYLSEYDATDKKGRYLHWSLLKWRVPTKEASNIWSAVKFKRAMIEKIVPLVDDKGKLFTYCTPPTIEAKLHQIVKVAAGSVASVAGGAASDSIQHKYLVSSLIMEEAITSAQLEGASTTREVAKKMLEDEREPVDEDERMILNNYFLLRHASRVKEDELTIDLILEFHRIATKGTTENNVVPGEFRQDNDIYVEDDQGEIAHQPPCYTTIPDRLSQLCDFANKDHSGLDGNEFIPPVIKAIVLHFMIGYEHPFRDGNGRTARALFYWFMLKHEYVLFKYVSISKLLKDDPKGYGLSYMYTEKDNNDLTYFIDFQLDIILAAFDELQSYLQKKTDEFYQVVKILENYKFSTKLNFVQKDLIKKAVKEPGRIFLVKEVANSYGLADNTARKHLNALVEMKLFLPTKDGRTTLYMSPSDLLNRLKQQ
ncbi:TPA: Fic family protein [Vibrio parahaemolyticus]|nr:Fic family protein [Vibrio parahaemolyticus]